MHYSTRNDYILMWLAFTFLACTILGGCASPPAAEPFQAHWEIIQRPGEPLKACLPEDDVAKLREILIRCKTDCETSEAR